MISPSNKTLGKSVVLMRPGSVTHSTNFDQRTVRCYFDPIPACTDDLTGCQTTVTAPWSCYTAPPGYYLLFVVDSTDVPSEAARVRLTYPPRVGMMMAQFGDLSQEAESAPTSPFENYPLTVEFRDPSTRAVKAVYTMPMDAPVRRGSVAARFLTDLPAGMYELYVRPYRSWLGRKLPVQWAPESTITVSLINGDFNGDNRVNELDLERLVADLSRTGVDLPSAGALEGYNAHFVLKYDPEGNLLWRGEFNVSPSYPYTFYMTMGVTDDGKVYVSDYIAGCGFALMQLSSVDGSVLWRQPIVLPREWNAGVGLCWFDRQGNVYGCGIGTRGEGSRNVRWVITKFDREGRQLWAWRSRVWVSSYWVGFTAVRDRSNHLTINHSTINHLTISRVNLFPARRI